MDADVAVRLRRVIAKLSRQLNASATNQGLTPAQASALGLIAGRGPLSLSQLTRIEGLNPTMMSRVVGRLDELGLILRTPDPRDLRAAMVEITDEGRRVGDRVRAERASVMSESCNRLSTPEADAIIAALPAFESLAAELDER